MIPAALRRCLALAALTCLTFSAPSQTVVQDIFGRALNQNGITLVDWDGYMANPALKFYLFPPTNGVLPGSAVLTANGDRLYFDTPSTVSTSGPSKTISFTAAAVGVPVHLSLFPDRDSADEDYTLTIVFTGADSQKQTNTVPLHVMDLDLQRSNDFVVTANFDRDITGVFTNSTRRLQVTQAANDWTYFFSGMGLDQVHAGTEQTFIWSNNFNGGYYFANTNTYTGYLLYAYGTTNSTHVSGGEGSSAGLVQTSNGVPLTIKRSGGFESEIYGNYNTLGSLFLTNDDDWLVSGNLASETNDFYSIAHHEIGHALIFNQAHPGFATARNNGAFTSAAVTNYYGGPVMIDPATDHLTNAIDPESLQGAFGHEFYGSIPRKRWVMTKLDLLCAQEVGYVLRDSSAFAPLSIPIIDPPPAATQYIPYTLSFGGAVSGGIPIYDWDITSGALPSGLTLDSFTGTFSGTPTTNGTFDITLRVRDYHEGSAGISRSFPIRVNPSTSAELGLSVTGQGPDSQAQLVLSGPAGQRQVLQTSSNLVDWVSVATNNSGTNLYYFNEPNPSQFPDRFYRALVLQ